MESGKDTLKERLSKGIETRKTEMASFSGIDTVSALEAEYFFRSSFFRCIPNLNFLPILWLSLNERRVVIAKLFIVGRILQCYMVVWMSMHCTVVGIIILAPLFELVPYDYRKLPPTESCTALSLHYLLVVALCNLLPTFVTTVHCSTSSFTWMSCLPSLATTLYVKHTIHSPCYRCQILKYVTQ